MPTEIQKRIIEDEIKESYLDYAMSVIVGRALPDAKDGLKPVHRRILYAMYKAGLFHDKKHTKCARIVGDVLGKYHPHGDSSVYEALVRMSQDFSLRYPLIDGQGNFGSIDGDSAAAYRYTEAKLKKIAEELLEDIDKETVDFTDNFDGTTQEPIILPAKIPNLLINGSSGIAVGMATNIPPHNITEIMNALVAMNDNPEININDLIEIVKGPDFPTGASICGTSGIRSAYITGRGRIVVKSRTKIEVEKDQQKIIVTEIPYMVNKSSLIQTMANLVETKVVEGITDLRDESDKRGIRIVIEVKKGASPEVILNQLYKHTQLKETFGVIMLALVDNKPVVLNLKQMLEQYIFHRKYVVIKRTEFELKKAQERAHILLGLKIALSEIDNVVKTIKSSKDVNVARSLLIENFTLTEIQANAILDMKLQKLTSLETEKLMQEHDELMKMIEQYKEILASESKIFGIIKSEVIAIRDKYQDERRTDIIEEFKETDEEELIEDEEVVITITHSGYVKKIPLDTYKQQRRGGAGVIATETNEEDVVEQLFTCSTKDYILLFTNKGKAHWLKAYHIPTGTRYAKGKALINLIKLDQGERVTSTIPIKSFDKGYIVMITKKGLIKKCFIDLFANPRSGGIIAIKLRDNDELVNVIFTDGYKKLILATANGMAIRFDEIDAKPIGRTAMGVRAISLKGDDDVVSASISEDNTTVLTICENGFGKRSPIEDYRLIKRGGSGVINIKTTDRNGKVVGMVTVTDEDEVMFITSKGVIIRTPVKGISTIGRNTAGVKLMNSKSNDKVVSVTKIAKED